MVLSVRLTHIQNVGEDGGDSSTQKAHVDRLSRIANNLAYFIDAKRGVRLRSEHKEYGEKDIEGRDDGDRERWYRHSACQQKCHSSVRLHWHSVHCSLP